MAHRFATSLLAVGILACGLCRPAALGAEPAAGGTQTIDRITAVVGREILTQSEVGASASLQSAIDRQLELHTARRARVSVSDQEVEAALAEFRDRTGLATEEALAKALAGEHLTLAQYKAGVREQLLIQRLLARDINHDLLVSEDEARAVYERTPQAFHAPQQIRVAQILFSLPPKPTARDVARATDRVRRVSEQLAQGGDFADLAVRYSGGPEAAGGGDLGYFRTGELLPDLERAVGQLAPGQISQPIRTPLGIHLVKLVEVRPPRVRPFEEVRRTIEERLVREQGEHLLHEWLIALRRRVFVEIRPAGSTSLTVTPSGR